MIIFQKKLLEARINSLKYDIENSQNIDDVYKEHLKLKLSDMNTKYELLENHKPVSIYACMSVCVCARARVKEIYF